MVRGKTRCEAIHCNNYNAVDDRPIKLTSSNPSLLLRNFSQSPPSHLAPNPCFCYFYTFVPFCTSENPTEVIRHKPCQTPSPLVITHTRCSTIPLVHVHGEIFLRPRPTFEGFWIPWIPGAGIRGALGSLPFGVAYGNSYTMPPSTV